MRKLLRAGVITGAVLVAALLAIVQPPPATPGTQHEDIRPVGTNGRDPQAATLALHALEGSLLDPEDDASHLIGRHVRLVVDIARASNDVAFWIGTPPDDLLVVTNRDTRSGAERQKGLPSDFFGPMPRVRYALLTGMVEQVPYPEAMSSWGLTTRDKALLAERGVYVRVTGLIALPGGLRPDAVPSNTDEWNRTTAPPPGEQVETPLGVPPPP